MVARAQGRKVELPPPAVEEHDDMRELEEALRIDEHALEEALRDQPHLFYRVSSAYALDISRRDAAKQAMQDAEAAISLTIRENARRDEQKITEGEVAAKIQTSPKVTEARERLQRLNESVGKLAALKEAFQQRSYALKDLASLYVANYYTASEENAGARAIRQVNDREGRRALNAARRSGENR